MIYYFVHKTENWNETQSYIMIRARISFSIFIKCGYKRTRIIRFHCELQYRFDHQRFDHSEHACTVIALGSLKWHRIKSLGTSEWMQSLIEPEMQSRNQIENFKIKFPSFFVACSSCGPFFLPLIQLPSNDFLSSCCSTPISYNPLLEYYNIVTQINM